MNSRDFFDMVCRMRKAQKNYFKTRDRDALNMSKEIEKQVDEEINRVNGILAKKKKECLLLVLKINGESNE